MPALFGTIAGVRNGSPSADLRGWIGLEKDRLYLFDAAIGTKVSFVAEGVRRTGTIRRINGQTSGSAKVVRYLSVADDTETWHNDEELVPVTWTVNLGEFELVPPLNRADPCAEPTDPAACCP